MQDMLQWLTGLPPAALYLALAAAAAFENVFPPFPADTVVAFGSFLAARGQATAVGAFTATWGGNLAGAMLVYAVGKRWASGRMRARLRRFAGEKAEERIETLYQRHGMMALFLSRFLPGVRAVVPPFAGALGLPAIPVAVTIGSASALWYGFITILAFQVGENWEELSRRIATMSRVAAAVAGVLVLSLAIAWWVVRRRERARS